MEIDIDEEALAKYKSEDGALDGDLNIPCAAKEKETDRLVDLFDKMVFMSDELPALLRKSENQNISILKNETVNKYLHNIIVYFLDRYLPKAAEDAYILGKVAIATVLPFTIKEPSTSQSSIPKRWSITRITSP